MLVNMNEMLKKAAKGKYGVGFFNAINVEMARAVIETAEEMNSPIIVGTAEILLGTMELERVAQYLIPMAQKATVPVCVHYDHGLTLGRCMQAIDLGFTSIMYDCSTADYEENVKGVSEITKICHEKNITVEGELGHVGDNFGEGKLLNPEDFYTDSAMARDFVTRTGVDALAVAVGNAHGDYAFAPKLDFDRITSILQSTGIPLVLHGSSGIPKEDLQKAISCGISKINIFTDIDKAGKAGIEKGLKEGAKSMMGLVPYEIEAMKEVVREKIAIFGSAGRA